MMRLFNLSVSCANIPAVWKSANIIPILKPGKPASDRKSYCPISLLSPVAEILECLLLPFVTTDLPKYKSQHGFAAFHSTTSALLPIVTKAVNGFNKKKPPTCTATVAPTYPKHLTESTTCSSFNRSLGPV
jgi:hypothetical protein